jgi:glycosyltransferase involved in cell wall biosynthesis
VRGDARLDLAGTGLQESDYRALAKRLNLDDRVRFHGWLDAGRIAELLRPARALVFPSIWHEPGGLGALEAMAAGRAVIASPVGGLPEFVQDEHTGLLVDAGDDAALTAAIERLASDDASALRFGEAARARVIERHALSDHMHRLLQIYREPTDAVRSAGALGDASADPAVSF